MCCRCAKSFHFSVITIQVCVRDFESVLYRAEGLPIPTVQWYKDDRAVKIRAELYEQSYHFPTNYPHKTTYTCVSKNKTGGLIRTTKANLTVIAQRKYKEFVA